MSGNKSFTILFSLIVLVIIGAIIYQSQIKPYKDLAKEQAEIITEQEQEIQELEDKVAGNYTAPPQEEEKMSLFTMLLLIGFIFLGLVVLYLLLFKPTNEEKELEEALKYYRGTLEKGYSDGYWYKILGEKLYRFISYQSGYYFGDHKFPIALIVFCANPNWHGEGEPALEWMRGIVYDKYNFRKIVEVFLKGNTTIDDMMRYMVDTSNARRGTHYKPVTLRSYQQEALLKVAKQQQDFFTDVNREVAVQQAMEGVA